MPVGNDGLERLWFLNTYVIVRIGYADGADGLSVLESRAPLGDSPPLHVHHNEDEVFHILEGEIRFRVGDEEIRARAGDSLLAPKCVAHSYRVASPGGARFLTVTRGGNFERFVRAFSRPAERSGVPDPSGPPTAEQAEALARACRQHGIDLVGPPME